MTPVDCLERLVAWARAGDADAVEYCRRAWGALQTGEGVLLTQAQLASALNVSTRHVRALTARGDIPVVRVGDAPRYRLDQVLAALASESE